MLELLKRPTQYSSSMLCMKLKVYILVQEPLHFFVCICINITFITLDSNGTVAVDDDGEERDIFIKLEDILIFATGAAQVPPMGFSEQPTVAFKH